MKHQNFESLNSLCQRAKERIKKFGKYTVNRTLLQNIHQNEEKRLDRRLGRSYLTEYLEKLRDRGFHVEKIENWIRLTRGEEDE